MEKIILTAEQEHEVKRLCGLAADGDAEAMRLVADAIDVPVQQEFEKLNVIPMMYTEKTLDPGQRAVAQVSPIWNAWYMSIGGDPQMEVLGRTEIDVPQDRVYDNPMVDVDTLRNGNLGDLQDIAMKAGWHIRDENCKRGLRLASAAVPASNTIEVAGDVITPEAWGAALSVLEDQDLRPTRFFMRGAHLNDLRNWLNTSPDTKRESELFGTVRLYADGKLAQTQFMPKSEVLVMPDKEVGRSLISNPLRTIPQNAMFKTGWLVSESRGFLITVPQWMAKIKLIGVVDPPTLTLTTAPATGTVGTPVTAKLTFSGDKGAINWGDNTDPDYVATATNKTHTYTQAGTYTVTGITFDTTHGKMTAAYWTIVIS